MATHDLTVTLLTDKTPQQVYDAINHVEGWWSENFTGTSTQLNREFEVFFGDVHRSKHKVIELIPNQKVVWLVTDSRLNFLQNKSEWNGTVNVFEITPQGTQTQITFTHQGLTPEIECYEACSGGWNYYIKNSLLPYINTGKGQPQEKQTDCASTVNV